MAPSAPERQSGEAFSRDRWQRLLARLAAASSPRLAAESAPDRRHCLLVQSAAGSSPSDGRPSHHRLPSEERPSLHRPAIAGRRSPVAPPGPRSPSEWRPWRHRPPITEQGAPAAPSALDRRAKKRPLSIARRDAARHRSRYRPCAISADVALVVAESLIGATDAPRSVVSHFADQKWPTK